MRAANKAILRERHPTPTVDDIIHDLNGSKVFSKIDLLKGYHQVEIEDSSRYITTFATHAGIFRYKCLNFGISSASEIFQNVIQRTIFDINGSKNISDDIIIHGPDKATHDEALKKVLDRLVDNGLTINEKKCKLNMNRILFYGYIFSENGISPDPEKITAIKDAPAPETPTEVRSFLGMVNHCGRFIKNLASLTAPLRILTHKNAPWKWSEEHDRSIASIKKSLSETSSLTFFDQAKETFLHTDASPLGLGAVLTQEKPGQPPSVIAYASRSLTETESRYSQIEREALAIVWACQHFYLYLIGSSFTVVTDHKPLITFFNSSHSRPSARIERWCLNLQEFDFTVMYQPGSKNPADYMSRHPVQVFAPSQENSALMEEHIRLLATAAVPKAITFEEVQKCTENDPELQEVLRCLQLKNWPTSRVNLNIKKYEKIRTELCSYNGVLLRGSRLVIPGKLQTRTIELAHQGHQGIVKTKMLLREKVWFPGMNMLVEDMVKSCIACAATTPQSTTEPLQPTELPPAPWTHISIDFCGPLPSGHYLVVVIDDYSRFPLVEITTSTSAQAVIPKLDKIFSTYGTPVELKSDNGPPFNSEEFKRFANAFGFKHRKIMPYWPQANGEAERFMRTLKKNLQISQLHHSNPWQKDLQIFLRSYRSTPHSSTNRTPSELFLGRKARTTLPELPPQPTQNDQLRSTDKKAKDKNRVYSDKVHHSKPRIFKKGDIVLLKRQNKGKLSSPYYPIPCIVTELKGTMVTVNMEGRNVTRNKSHFKHFKKREFEQHQDSPREGQLVGTSKNTEKDKSRKSTANPQDAPLKLRPKRKRNPPKFFIDEL